MNEVYLTTSASPPPSPSTLLKAQIVITKAAQGKAKAKKVAKSHVEKENKRKNGKSDKGPGEGHEGVCGLCCGQGKEDHINFVSDFYVLCCARLILLHNFTVGQSQRTTTSPVLSSQLSKRITPGSSHLDSIRVRLRLFQAMERKQSTTTATSQCSSSLVLAV
jgi:hypothetical protein